MTFLRSFSLFSLLLLLVSGCRKSTHANWDVDLLLPVVNSVLNINNFNPDSTFKADAGGVMHLVINREVASLMMDSLLSLPDTVIPKDFTNDFIATTLKPGQGLTLQPSNLQFNVSNGVGLKTVIVKSAMLHVKFSNDVAEPLDLIYQLPGVTKDGNFFTISEIIPSGKNSLVKSYDLSGYKMDLSGPSGNKVNTLLQNYTVNLSTTASGTAVVESGKGAHIELSYSEVVPQFVEGYFGTQVVKMPYDSTRISLVNDFKASNFMLSEAKMDF